MGLPQFSASSAAKDAASASTRSAMRRRAAERSAGVVRDLLQPELERMEGGVAHVEDEDRGPRLLESAQGVEVLGRHHDAGHAAVPESPAEVDDQLLARQPGERPRRELEAALRARRPFERGGIEDPGERRQVAFAAATRMAGYAR